MDQLAKTDQSAVGGLIAIDDRGVLQLNSMKAVTHFSNVAYESGLVTDARSSAQVQMKIFFGRPMGLTATECLNDLHIFQGKIMIGTPFLAKKLKQSKKYKAKVIRSDDEICELEYSEFIEESGQWEIQGRIKKEFRAGMELTGEGKKKFPWINSRQRMLYYWNLREARPIYFPDLLETHIQIMEEMDEAETFDRKEEMKVNPAPFIAEKSKQIREERKAEELKKAQEKAEALDVEIEEAAPELNAPDVPDMSVVDHYQSAVDVAIEGGAPKEVIDDLKKKQDEQNKPKPGDFLKLQAAGKKQGWEPSSIGAFIKLKYPDLGDSFQKTMNMATYNEIFKFISNNTFGSENITALGVK